MFLYLSFRNLNRFITTSAVLVDISFSTVGGAVAYQARGLWIELATLHFSDNICSTREPINLNRLYEHFF